MDELIALARECNVSVAFDGTQFRFEARKQVGGKTYGIAFTVSDEEASNANTCIVSRRLREMQRAMGMEMTSAS